MKLYPSRYNIDIINDLVEKIEWKGFDDNDRTEEKWYNFLDENKWWKFERNGLNEDDAWNKWFNELPISNKKELYIILIDIIEKRKL